MRANIPYWAGTSHITNTATTGTGNKDYKGEIETFGAAIALRYKK